MTYRVIHRATVFPIKSFHFSIFHKCSHIYLQTKGATDKRHTFLESASLSDSASICVELYFDGCKNAN